MEETSTGNIKNEEKIKNCIKQEVLRWTVKKNSHCRLKCHSTICGACLISNRRGHLKLQEMQAVNWSWTSANIVSKYDYLGFFLGYRSFAQFYLQHSENLTSKQYTNTFLWCINLCKILSYLLTVAKSFL